MNLKKQLKCLIEIEMTLTFGGLLYSAISALLLTFCAVPFLLKVIITCETVS